MEYVVHISQVYTVQAEGPIDAVEKAQAYAKCKRVGFPAKAPTEVKREKDKVTWHQNS